jgi:hypothetical protein
MSRVIIEFANRMTLDHAQDPSNRGVGSIEVMYASGGCALGERSGYSSRDLFFCSMAGKGGELWRGRNAIASHRIGYSGYAWMSS